MKKAIASGARKKSIVSFFSMVGDIFVVAGGSLLLLAIGALIVFSFLYVLKSLLGINIIADFSLSGTLLGK